MTKDQKIEHLRELIAEACPDVMELKFGCEIRNKNGAVETIATYSNYGHFTVVGGSSIPSIESDIIEILGSPIGIAEVLRAWNNSDSYPLITKAPDELWDIYCVWDLSHDRIEDQKLSTIDFIIGVLDEKKV